MTMNLVITPIRTAFDLDLVRCWLDARPDTIEDPTQTDHYLVCGDPLTASFEYEQICRRQKTRERESNVYLQPRQILLTQEQSGTDDLRSSMEFLEWLVKHFDCDVRVDGYGTDLTTKIKSDGPRSIYPEDVQAAPVPWASSLIGIGFYQELYDGQSFDSLRHARRDVAGSNDEAIATYLEAGHLYRRVDEPAEDWLSDVGLDIGPPHLLTDGVYVWPAVLPYYVRTYHVKLPRHFVSHVRANGWRMPGQVDIASLSDFRI